MDEQTVAQAALEAFVRETGLPGTLVHWDTDHHDCKVRLSEHELNGDIKRWASHNLPLLLQRCSPSKEALLLADYINGNVAKQLQAAGIQFIDTQGNAFIDLPNLKVRIAGNRPASTSANVVTGAERIERVDRALQPKGLMVIYHLLTDEQALVRSMRDIAQRTGVAHGTVGIVLKALEDAIYLRRDRKGRLVFHDRKGLIERWVQGYAEKLEPKLLIGAFLDESPQWWGSPEVGEFDAVWGGEIAGREYTHYLQPQIATLYVPDSSRAAIMQRHGLRQAPKGTEPNIKLMRRFWSDENDRASAMASPLLTYAELIASGDARNLETARMIHDHHLASS